MEIGRFVFIHVTVSVKHVFKLKFLHCWDPFSYSETISAFGHVAKNLVVKVNIGGYKSEIISSYLAPVMNRSNLKGSQYFYSDVTPDALRFAARVSEFGWFCL